MRRFTRVSTLLVTAAVIGAVAVPAHSAGVPGVVDYTIPAARDTDPVVLTGKDFGVDTSWSVPQNLTFAIPEKDLPCYVASQDTSCPDEHNHYVEPDVDTATFTAGKVEGTAVDKILGYKWDGKAFVQIPFQVDEVFTRYLNNDASGFGIYSGTDQHTTYAYDREGFRYTADKGVNSSDPCTAQPASKEATDPVKGLDSNDELAFMASDAGTAAPAGAAVPKGIAGVKVVTLRDPTNPAAPTSYVYVMRAAADGPKPAFNAKNGYVTYQRHADANSFAYSQSSYGDYGAAAKGYYCDADGHVVRNGDGTPKIGQRRPRDTATITTGRYKFRYDGRWLMTSIRIAKPGAPGQYGPDIVDRWKARAFAQDPGSNTPCCGYEEEDTNWGGSSILLGERKGPVRAIRETWGADSGTNVIRRESFYRDSMIQKTWLRVHVIPPLDGIYAQWDFNAGKVNRFYNSHNPDGVAIDGHNDEVYGNFDDPCNPRWEKNDRSQIDAAYRSVYQSGRLCDLTKAIADNDPSGQTDWYHQSIDPGDLTFADANATLGWSEVAGPNGTIVDRISSSPTDLTPGGAVQGLAAVPYYRDDSCFDDGTGSDPGPVINLRSDNEKMTDSAGNPRKCWTPADGDPKGSDHFFQGDIAAHGLHLLFQADSDNARLTVPLTEIVSNWQMTMLPGDPGNVGEQYGRGFEKPLVATVGD
ncbi:MAG: hypothetical protein QOI98_1956 [Solirubrobacteraceae bacterium]|nr:hypothetical protein [Solirubrobacteraceae bacterium]